MPDSPSRNAASWLSSPFSRSVEMQWRYGWLRMVFTRCASSELQFEALREVVVREKQGALSRKDWEGTAALYRVSAYQVRGGPRAARSSTSQGSAATPCARVNGANRVIYEAKCDSGHGMFFFL